ncbi:MAG TPA: DUF2723 domain-containing protein [Kofleriaceae bacterium]|nr:DUF2723 domain-containing protein [Kofleriaceae bacterium]
MIERRAMRAPAAELTVFAIVAAVYAVLAAPGVGWMDSGELTAAAWSLGGAHPPGHPAHSLLGKLASLAPLGEIAFRVNLLSGLAMAAALAGVVAVARRLSPDPAAAVAAGVVGAALAALAPAASSNAIRAEVYGPVAALLLWGLAAALDFIRGDARPRSFLLCAGACAAAAAFHPVIAASAALPMAIALALAARRRLLRLAPWALALGALALASYAYLPVRASAASTPLLVWGDPSSASGLVDLVTAVPYQSNFSLGGALVRAATGWMRAGEGTGLGLLFCGLVGLGFAAATRLRGAGTALAVAACVVAGAGLQDALNPDLRGYLLPALLVLAAGLSPLLAAALRMLPADLLAGVRQRRVAIAAILAPAVAAGFLAGSSYQLDRGDDPLRLWSDTVARMPPGPGVYFASGDHTLFAAQHERIVAGGRPDIAVVHEGLCHDEWFLRHVRRLLPELYVPYLDDGVKGALPERLAVSNMRKHRPVGGDEPGFGRLMSSHARPIGRGYQYLLEPGDVPPGRAAPPPPDFSGDIGARVAAMVGIVRADYEVQRGRLGSAARAAGIEERLSPADRAALATARPRADRPALFVRLPRETRVLLFEPWIRDVFADDLLWQAGRPVAPPPDDAPPERVVHAAWRAVLTGELAPGAEAILDLGPAAAAATTRVLIEHASDAAVETHLRAVLTRWPDDAASIALLASVRANRGDLAEAERLFVRALELAPDAETQRRLDAVRARRPKK